MKGSLLILAFFVLGVVLGLTKVLALNELETELSFYALAALMFCVGVGLGSDLGSLRSLKRLNPRLLLLPVLTIAGTLSGAAFSSVFFHGRSVADCLAVGSGMAYYSLSSVFITQYKGAELGAVALLANIARELITLMCAPLLVKLWGWLRYRQVAQQLWILRSRLYPVTRGVTLLFCRFIMDFCAISACRFWLRFSARFK